MKLASLIAIFMFGALAVVQATPIYLTATEMSVYGGCCGPAAYVSISGSGFGASIFGAKQSDPPYFAGVDFSQGPSLPSLTIGSTTYENLVFAGGVGAELTSKTIDCCSYPHPTIGSWSASGPATATDEISVCLFSVAGGTCDPALAFAIIDSSGLKGTIRADGLIYPGLPGSPDFELSDVSGSLSITPEPLNAGIVFAGLLLLTAYGRYREKIWDRLKRRCGCR